MATNLLHVVIFLPLLGAAILMLLPKEEKALLRGFGIGVGALTFLLSLPLWMSFDATSAGMQYVTDLVWVQTLGIHYKVGIDGISLWLVLLTTFFTPITLLSATRAVDDRVKEFVASFLVLETAMIGTLAAMDLFLFYVFWESMLIPMYLIIGIWGGRRRLYATVKFFLYTMAGSVLMLVAVLYLYFNVGAGNGLDVENLQRVAAALEPIEQKWLFGAFLFAFAVKVPMFPLHTWLPDAHTEAPTAGSVILAAVLLKMGTYGLLRFALPMFPVGTVVFGPLLAVLSVIAIIYGAFMALAQHDVKRLVAYSSVSHLGFVTLGLVMGTDASVQGALLQMVNHGLSTGALFLAIGVLYERRHTRLIAEYGGVAKSMPRFAVVFMIATLSSIGLPGLNGFVGEFLVLIGTYTSTEVELAPLYAALAASGVIFGAVYMLWMYQRVMFGPIKNPKNAALKDLSVRETVVFVPLIAMMVIIGVYPKLVIDPMAPSVAKFTEAYARGRAKARLLVEVEEAHADDLSVKPGSLAPTSARPAAGSASPGTATRPVPGARRLPPGVRNIVTGMPRAPGAPSPSRSMTAAPGRPMSALPGRPMSARPGRPMSARPGTGIPARTGLPVRTASPTPGGGR